MDINNFHEVRDNVKGATSQGVACEAAKFLFQPLVLTNLRATWHLILNRARSRLGRPNRPDREFTDIKHP